MTTLDSFLPKIKDKNKNKVKSKAKSKNDKDNPWVKGYFRFEGELDIYYMPFNHKPRITEEIIKLALEDYDINGISDEVVDLPIGYVDHDCECCEHWDQCFIIDQLYQLSRTYTLIDGEKVKIKWDKDQRRNEWLYWRCVQFKCPTIQRKWKKGKVLK